MNPILIAAQLKAAEKRARERRCPKCGTVQQVAKSQMYDPMPCSKCGTPVPPNKPTSR